MIVHHQKKLVLLLSEFQTPVSVHLNAPFREPDKPDKPGNLINDMNIII